MNLHFLGATRQVTGSQYYLHCDGARILIDCGMFQERDYLGRNWEPFSMRTRDIDAVILTHAHLDHCGLLPRLVQEGFRGPVLATAPSADLVELVLRDSAEIQAEDVEFKKKRHRKEGRKGRYPEKPLYTMKDVDRALPLVRPVAYEQPVPINEHATAVLHDAGHILGSAMIELRVRDNGHVRRLVFSGDIGQWNKPIIRDPSVFAEADFVVMESTYGNRDHPGADNVETQLAEVIGQTVGQGGNVVIPIFAIERAQELIYHMSRLLEAQRIPRVPVFLDSPMAADVTEVFRRHRECFDLETWQLILSGSSPLGFPGLKILRTAEQSKEINDLKSPAVIMATSGMCTSGRIKHHLAHNIGRPESTILFAGYQSQGTLGRQILDGSREVRIHGRSLLVRARIAQIEGVSGHADHAGLLRWLSYLQVSPRRLFLTHGEEESSLSLAREIAQQKEWSVTVPEYKQAVHLETN